MASTFKISRICPLFATPVVTTLLQATTGISRLDHRHSLPADYPLRDLRSAVRSQHTGQRDPSRTRSDHGSSLLRGLRWLPICPGVKIQSLYMSSEALIGTLTISMTSSPSPSCSLYFPHQIFPVQFGTCTKTLVLIYREFQLHSASCISPASLTRHASLRSLRTGRLLRPDAFPDGQVAGSAHRQEPAQRSSCRNQTGLP